jgi:hypothetical protein
MVKKCKLCMKKKDKERFEKLSQIGCIACSKQGRFSTPVIHHIRKNTGISLRPSPIPNNIYDPQFEKIWSLLDIRRGSKFKAHEIWNKLYYAITLSEEQLSQIYNKQINGIEDKFVPHFSTWLSQRRWENEEIRDEGISIRAKMEKLGYIFRHREDNFDYFKKDGKEYKIDRYDKDHIIQKAE